MVGAGLRYGVTAAHGEGADQVPTVPSVWFHDQLLQELDGPDAQVDREAFLEDPQSDKISSVVNFQNWTGVGAELWYDRSMSWRRSFGQLV